MTSEYMKQILLKDEVDAKSVDEAVDTVLQDEVEVIDNGPRDKQVLIRVSEIQRDQWAKAAETDSLIIGIVRFLSVLIRLSTVDRILGLSIACFAALV